MKLAIALLLSGVIAATALESTKSLQNAQLEVKLHHEGDHDAEIARETDRRSDVIIGLGKRLRNVADNLKVVAKQQEKNDDEVSPYGWGGIFKNLIKSAVKTAAKAGAKQFAKDAKDIIKQKYKEHRNRTATYKMEDSVPRLSQLYLYVAEEVENLGKVLEIVGAETAVGHEVRA